MFLSGVFGKDLSGLVFCHQGIHAFVLPYRVSLYHITRHTLVFNLIKHPSSSPVHSLITLFHLLAYFEYRQHIIILVFTPLFCSFNSSV